MKTDEQWECQITPVREKKTLMYIYIHTYLGSLEKSSLVLLILRHAGGVLQNNKRGEGRGGGRGWEGGGGGEEEGEEDTTADKKKLFKCHVQSVKQAMPHCLVRHL